MGGKSRPFEVRTPPPSLMHGLRRKERPEVRPSYGDPSHRRRKGKSGPEQASVDSMTQASFPCMRTCLYVQTIPVTSVLRRTAPSRAQLSSRNRGRSSRFAVSLQGRPATQSTRMGHAPGRTGPCLTKGVPNIPRWAADRGAGEG